MTTLTTVGYGDMAPRTGAGRALVSFMALCGPVLLSLVGARLAQPWLARFEHADSTARSSAPQDVTGPTAVPRKRVPRPHIAVQYTE